ncbi:[SSU ribosomal protein S18P]-alanine acetyltransferase [Terribacillus aidingensis]|uniref:[SSU ribosomal protein S18P]-alanine acetyltransferase n=1 Tax=Terribacillus aidingensis TaxID=586416 RepID=A0A285P2C1_9BACI|nr:[SSU ribosomal protein S18P]-alanine acetyltransferase [Terribacillus aidingensis]
MAQTTGAAKVSAQPIVRQMQLADIPAVYTIETASFATPWTIDIFEREITENTFASYFVIENEGVIAGYCGMWLVIDEAQITNIAILPSYRGKKLGEKLFAHVMEQAILAGAYRLSLEVRVSNLPAQHLYRKFGLVPGGIRKNYYTDNQEDAIVMWVNL